MSVSISRGSIGSARAMSRVPIGSILNQAPSFPPPPPSLTQRTIEENGREYYANGINVYPYPCDDPEKERQEAMHEAWYANALETLHIATLRPGRLRILDVGYGTGIWALEMKQSYPQAEIAAIDICSNYQTKNGVNEGVHFYPRVDFTQNDWGFADATFDFVHSAMLCGSVSDWQHFVGRISSLLKPGGQAEFLELDWEPRCDGPPLPNSDDVWHWWDGMQATSAAAGRSIAYPDNLEMDLQRAGCTVVNHRVVQVHTSEDFLSLPVEDPQSRIARWYRYFMFLPHFKTIEGMTMALFTHWGGWPPADVSALCDRVQWILNASRSPIYHNLYELPAGLSIWWEAS